MKRTLALVVVAVLGACATEQPQFTLSRRPIIGGTVDQNHTSVVALVYSMYGYTEQFCTGTVISQRAVLTAGHCIAETTAQGMQVSDMSVFFGTTVGSGGQTIKVQDAQYHPNYYTRSDGAPINDVAVVTLAQDAPVPPMKWQRTTLADPSGQTVTFVGYGVTNAQAQSGNGTRRTVDEVVQNMDDTFIYYGGGASGTCQGDSGGPMFLNVNGEEILIGVTSYGDQSCVQLGANTRVDKYADFIAPLAPVPLTLTLTAPTDQSTQGSAFTVSAAPDSLAGVAKVEYFVDGVSQGSLTAPPWDFEVTGVADGAHEVEVNATANDGQVANASVHVNVVTAAFGGACTANAECSSGVCAYGDTGNGYCTQVCTTKAECPNGVSCDVIDPSTSICGRPAGSGGGCRVGGAPAGGATVALLVGLALLGLARRRPR
jgi:secreted trypsin-like serine protease